MNKLKGRSAPQTPTSVEELAMSGRRSKRSMNGEMSSSSDRERERGDRSERSERSERDRRSNRGGGSLDGETGSNRSRDEVRTVAGRSSRGATGASPSLNGEVSVTQST